MKLFLLPGLDGTGQQFEPLLRALPNSFSTDVIAYPTDRRLDYRQLCEHVSDYLPRDVEYSLLGESFSSPIAIWLAARRPRSLRGLILVCGFASNPQKSLSPLASLVEYLPTRGIAARVASRFLLGASTRQVSERLDQAILSVEPTVIRHRLRQIASLDARESVAQIDVPVLYLRGERDRLVGRRSMSEIARACPALQTRQLDGPHLLLQERPDDCAREIAEFLSRTN